jgi:hypothetical protein
MRNSEAAPPLKNAFHVLYTCCVNFGYIIAL